MNTEQVIEGLLSRVDVQLSPEARALLPRSAEQLGPAELQPVQDLLEPLFLGFFQAASVGHAFVPSERIEQRFGRTLAMNYPEAGLAFLRMATTYWTLKMVLSDDWDRRETVGYQLLSKIEADVGALFFPTPGPVKIDPVRRATDQRAFLQEVAPQIDIDDFMANNPILQRDRQSQSRGCLAIPLLVAGSVLELMMRS